MDISAFLEDYMVIPIAVICFCIGYIIRNTPALEKISNNYIPAICGVVGLLLGIWMGGFTIQAIAEGLVSGLAATGFHQLYSQYAEKVSGREADEEVREDIEVGEEDVEE